MSLQNFVDRAGPVISAAWLNAVDALKYSIFNDATTKAAARAALTSDLPLEPSNGGTGVRSIEELQNLLHPAVDAVNGYIVLDGPNSWSRGNDGTTWTPNTVTLQADATFTQSGADVARVAWRVTRDANGILTGASIAHTGGDLNVDRVTVTELSEGTQVFAVQFTYSYLGVVSTLTQTVTTTLASTGSGPAGPGALTITLNKPFLSAYAYQDGSGVDFTNLDGLATVWSGTNDVTASASFNTPTATNCTGTVNTATDTPVAGKAKGYYKVNSMSQDTATLVISATYNGATAYATLAISKIKTGVEIVGTLPNTNNFEGRLVYLSTDGKLYRYHSGAWTKEVDGADLKANSVTTNSILAGAITAAKLAVTTLSAIAANVGTLTAGILQSISGGFRIDLDNAKILINTAPGATGGKVFIIGYGFGPSSSYLLWYGDKPAGQSSDSGIVANLTDSGSLFYLKTDGSLLFSGRARGEFEPKAWGVFDGRTGGTATIKDRFNVASITRTGTGTYAVAFAAAQANANYMVVSNADKLGDGTDVQLSSYNSPTVNGFNIDVRGTGGGHNDAAVVSFLVFGSNVSGGSNVTTPGGGYGGGTVGRGNIP